MSIMSNRVSKPPFKRSRLKLSKCLQQELLNALASEDTGMWDILHAVGADV